MRERKRGKSVGLSEMSLYWLLIMIVNVLLFSTRISLVGAGYLGITILSLYVLTEVLTNWISNFVSKYVKGRMSRKQYINAHHFGISVMIYTIITHLMVTVLLFVFGKWIGTFLYFDIQMGICIRAIAPFYFVLGLRNALFGYFKGMGITNPVKISMIISTISMFVCSFIGFEILTKYGEKVAALLQNHSVTDLYGILGIVIGWTVGAAIGILVLMIFYAMLSGEFHRERDMDQTKYPEGILEGIKTMVIAGLYQSLTEMFLVLPLLLNYYLYVRIDRHDAGIAEAEGGLFGITIPCVALIVLLFELMFQNSYKGIPNLIKNEQHNLLRDKIDGILYTLCLICLPVAIVVSVLGEPIFSMITATTNEFGILSMNFSGTLILCFTIEIMLLKILQFVFERNYVIAISVISFVAQTAVCILLLGMGMEGLTIIISVLINSILIIALAAIRLKVRLHYKFQSIRQLMLGGISTLLPGVLILVIQKFLGAAMGQILSILVCIVVYLIVYLLLLVILQVITPEVEEKIPLRNFFTWLGGLYPR